MLESYVMASVDLHEKANFTRLSRLLVDKGTEALRKTFDAIHPPANLPVVLNANRKYLLRLKYRVINSSQWDLLYPPTGNPPDSKIFDVSLLTVLLRNICNLPSIGWGAMPLDTDRSMRANIARIKFFRNEVYAHVTSTQVDNATFESLWQKIGQALVELNIPQNDVDDSKTCPLWPEEEIYVKTLRDWRLQDEECMKVLVSIESRINRLTEITEETREGKRSNENDEDLLRKLAKYNFKSKIRGKVKFFLPGTREWLLKEVDKWSVGNEHESRMLLLTAGPGFGKSVFAAKVCENFKKKRKLAACHFCDFSDSNLRNPMMMLQSLASQMCENMVGFKEKLLDQLKRPHEIHTLKDAFGIYLQNPLDELEVKEPSLVVIDGLDESAGDRKNEIVDLIADYFPDLLECVKVLVTSRPEISLEKLIDFKNINIESKDANNNSDLKIYLKACLPNLHERKADSDSDVLKTLVEMCEGSFLYAFYTQAELQKRDDLNKVTSQDIVEFLPKGLDSIYQRYFKRLEDELRAIMFGNLDLLRVLEMLVASKGPLPLTFVAQALGLAPDCRETKNIINKVNVTISCLLYVSDDMVTVFHKSVIDWLLARGYNDHEYTVKVIDGDRSLWLICEQIFEKIKETACTGHDLNLTFDVMYALAHGLEHLVACSITESFSWFVDVVIVYVLLITSCDEIREIRIMLHLWNNILRVNTGISDELRARISWHIVEIEFIPRRISSNSCLSPRINPPFYYLQSVLTHSPKGHFSDEEKKIAQSFLSKIPRFVDCTYHNDEVEVMPLAVWSVTSKRTIKAVGVSKDKTMAAVAQKNGRIFVISVPRLLELLQYSTEYEGISCCTFAPDGSFLLFGKLGTALNIAERKEVPFFDRNRGTFVSCAFSPNGKRLITSNGSSTIKLWDVAKQSLISLLRAGVSVNWCCFNRTGLFIIGYRKYYTDDSINVYWKYPAEDSVIENWEFDAYFSPVVDSELDAECSDIGKFGAEDSFCVWNVFTLQRSDKRLLPEVKEGNALHSKLCKRCFRPGFEILPMYKRCKIPGRSWQHWKIPCGDSVSTGIYNGVECSFALDNHSLSVIETTHFTTLAVWNCFIDDFPIVDDDDYDDDYDDVCSNISREIVGIGNNQWLYVDTTNVIVSRTLVPTCPTTVLWSSFSPDGSRLATCTSDGCINIWNVDTRQVEQRFKKNQGKPSFVCWWSEKFLFVFDLFDRIPSLSKYSVDANLKILFTQSHQVSLGHLVNEFISLSEVVDWSGGLLCFECDETKPVKVLDVNGVGGPRMVNLPGIEPMMSITVSPDGFFVFGGGKYMFYIWKRNGKEAAVYDVFFTHQPGILRKYSNNFVSCFSNDSKVAVVSYQLYGRVYVDNIIIDLDTGNYENVSFCYSGFGLHSKRFCINKDRVVIVASNQFIQFFDMDSGALLESSFQRYLINDLHTKLSPNETVLAFPKVNGDMEFLRLSIPQNPLLCDIKRKAAILWDNAKASLFIECDD